jgi:hypothetical protein
MDNPIERIPHIGIVAGTAEGAALCYRILCQEAESVMGRRHAHPEVTLHSFSLHRYLDAIDQDDWSGVAALLSQSAAKLAQVGADVIICPNNTLHKAFPLVESPGSMGSYCEARGERERGQPVASSGNSWHSDGDGRVGLFGATAPIQYRPHRS